MKIKNILFSLAISLGLISIISNEAQASQKLIYQNGNKKAFIETDSIYKNSAQAGASFTFNGMGKLYQASYLFNCRNGAGFVTVINNVEVQKTTYVYAGEGTFYSLLKNAMCNSPSK